MKILIIDDEYTIRHGIATVIRKYNERWTIVGEASDVSQALSIIRQERPDVIFLDIKMPIFRFCLCSAGFEIWGF